MLIFIGIFDMIKFIFIILFCPLDVPHYLYFITPSAHMTRYFIWELTFVLI